MSTILFSSLRPVKTNRTFGYPLVKPSNPGRLPLGPNPEDSAYVAGFDLGISWEDADPSSDLSPFCQDAFLAGWEAGRREAEQDRLEWCARFEEQLTAEVGYYERNEFEEVEMAEMGAVAWSDACRLAAQESRR